MEERKVRRGNTVRKTAAEGQSTEKHASAEQKAEKQASEQEAEKQAATEQEATEREAEQAARKSLSEMNLLDDFLFGLVVTYPGIGERFVIILLKIILGRKVKHLSVTAQKVFFGADSGLHGARLDVCLEPEIEEGAGGNATVYDIEPENRKSDRKALPRRMRFYHGKIAARGLKAGEDYEELKNAVVIMIMPFDPFGFDHMMYTIKNKCMEVPELEYEDGASTIFLYTKGTKGIPNEAVRQMLHYMEDTTCENAVNEELREIHRMVETVKKDQRVVKMRIKIVEDLIRQAEEITKLEDKNTEQAEEITKLEDENRRLREELARRNGQ